MGSNANRHFDKGMLDWGSKARKVESRRKKKILDVASIADGLIADDDADLSDDHCDQDSDGRCICEQEPHKTPGKRRKKDTKRWCRGKVGREHDWQPFNKYHGLRMWVGRSWEIHRCETCGKEKFTRP